jgi:FtsH-binding integral membrane protein
MNPEQASAAVGRRILVFMLVGPLYGGLLGAVVGIAFAPSGVLELAFATGAITGLVLSLAAVTLYRDEPPFAFAGTIIFWSAVGALLLAPIIGPFVIVTGAFGYMFGIARAYNPPTTHRTSPQAPHGAPGAAHSAQEEMK